MINEQFQQPQIDLKDTRDVACECGNVIFMPGFRFRKASKLLTGGDKDTIMPFEAFLCTNCGKPLQEFLPDELKTTNEEK
jgi:DNA-directed RNA polymerase subunit RPC12/RpoP